MKDLGNFLQLILACCFVIVAAHLNEQSELSKPASASPLVADLAGIQSKIAKVARGINRSPPEPDPAAQNLLRSLQSMTSLHDFTKLQLPKHESELMARIDEDEFDRGNPFSIVDQPYPMALILSRGVTSYQRDAYRSSHFQGQMGYDVIKYEITHPDQTTSFILAYKERTDSEQVGVGQKDIRPIFSMFLVPTENGQYFMSLTEENRPTENRELSQEEALKRVSSRVDSSTPLMTSRDSY